MDKKFEVRDASAEDQKAFADGLDKLLKELSLVIRLDVNKKAVSIKLDNEKTENGFIDQPILIIQKKVEIAEVEIKKENEISPEN